MLEVIRHHLLLACEWEEGDEDEWDDHAERLSSSGNRRDPSAATESPERGIARACGGCARTRRATMISTAAPRGGPPVSAPLPVQGAGAALRGP